MPTIARCSRRRPAAARGRGQQEPTSRRHGTRGALDGAAAVVASATTGEGVDRLRAALVEAAAGEPLRDVPAITNVRHVESADAARAPRSSAREAAAGAETPEEFVLADLNEARRRLEEVTGARTSDDVLHEIFARFCIGK